jgi:uncharacterized protein YkwD
MLEFMVGFFPGTVRLMVVFTSILLALNPVPAAAQNTATKTPRPPQLNSTIRALETTTFTPANFNTNLLNLAVVLETNRRRLAHGLPPLTNHLKAARAAEIQTRIMLRRGNIGHENPEVPHLRTLPDRMRTVGMEYRFAAENLALTFALQWESGKPFYIRHMNGHTVLSATPHGPPIPHHTYASFARALLDGWMNSPGHRKNILSREPIYIGVSSLPDTAGKSKGTMPAVYSTQVFFTPLNR